MHGETVKFIRGICSGFMGQNIPTESQTSGQTVTILP